MVASRAIFLGVLMVTSRTILVRPPSILWYFDGYFKTHLPWCFDGYFKNHPCNPLMMMIMKTMTTGPHSGKLMNLESNSYVYLCPCQLMIWCWFQQPYMMRQAKVIMMPRSSLRQTDAASASTNTRRHIIHSTWLYIGAHDIMLSPALMTLLLLFVLPN